MLPSLLPSRYDGATLMLYTPAFTPMLPPARRQRRSRHDATRYAISLLRHAMLSACRCRYTPR